MLWAPSLFVLLLKVSPQEAAKDDPAQRLGFLGRASLLVFFGAVGTATRGGLLRLFGAGALISIGLSLRRDGCSACRHVEMADVLARRWRFDRSFHDRPSLRTQSDGSSVRGCSAASGERSIAPAETSP